MIEKKFQCIECGKQEKRSKNNPKCCGKPMKQLPLDVCVNTSDAEQARAIENDEPCNDGRDG